MKSKLSEEEVKYIKKMAKKYNYKYKQAEKLFLKSDSKKEFVESLKGDLEETITTTSSGVTPGGTGEFKSRFGAKAMQKQYYADEEQRKEASESGFGVVKYLRQKLK
jgi:hypothetical protein